MDAVFAALRHLNGSQADAFVDRLVEDLDKCSHTHEHPASSTDVAGTSSCSCDRDEYVKKRGGHGVLQRSADEPETETIAAEGEFVAEKAERQAEEGLVQQSPVEELEMEAVEQQHVVDRVELVELFGLHDASEVGCDEVAFAFFFKSSSLSSARHRHPDRCRLAYR